MNPQPRALPALNGDMACPALMRTPQMEWQASPSGTVWRKRLHRVGDAESGPVTSVVRYDAGASFPQHYHPGGEEIFVKLRQYSGEGRVYCKTDSRKMKWKSSDRKGVERKPLYEDARFPDVTQLSGRAARNRS